MLRGQHRYNYVPSTASYHEIANPIISPIKGVNMRLPRTMLQTKEPVSQLGPLLRNLHPVVPDNGWYNTIAAFRKRCNYFNAGRATPRVVKHSMDFVHALCPKQMSPFDWNENLYRDWLSKFGSEKQGRMEAALHRLCEANINDYSRKDIFVKVEALLVTHKPNWAPRVIFKGTDLYNVLSGPIFNELMRRFDFCLEGMRGDYQFRTSYKKTPLDYTCHLERQSKDEYWLEADFSSNDKYQCSDVMLLEVAFMRCLGCPEWFVRLHLRTNKFTVKSSKQGISATLRNQLPTGATDTTFRNTFWNGCILWSFLKTAKIRSCRAMLMGDDMLAVLRGVCRYAVRTYVSIAAEARMEAKVVRHDLLWKATFLSKFFVPIEGQHLTVPILGKALGRFNMRANRNQAVSDHAYMAGKSVGYAYEFRFVPTIRDMFLERFKYEFAFLPLVGGKRQMEVDISWNARTAGVTLKNITKKLVEQLVISDFYFHYFCWERYQLSGNDVLDLFRDVVLGTEKIDYYGVVVSKLAQDFLG
jgi:hypothetical protein